MSDHRADRPLVAVLYTLPLMGEAIASSLETVADVRGFPAHGPDPVGLLNALAPAAVVVDDAVEAEAVCDWAVQDNVPLVHVRLRERKIKLLRHGMWEESIGASAEAIRNVIVRVLYARDAVET